MLLVLALSAISSSMLGQRVVVDGMITEWTGRGNEYYYGPVNSNHLNVIYIKPFEQMGVQFYTDEVLYGVELYRDGYFFSTNYGFYICENNGYVHQVREMPKYRTTSGLRFAYGGGYFNYAGIGRYGTGYGYYGGVSHGVANGVGRVIQGTVDGSVIGGTVGSSIGGAVGTVVGITNALKDRKACKQAEKRYSDDVYGSGSTRSSLRSSDVSTRSSVSAAGRTSSSRVRETTRTR